MIETSSDELRALRNLLGAFQRKELSVTQNGVDVTEREITRIEPDIAYLERLVEERATSHGK